MTYFQWLTEWINVYKKPYIKSWKKIKDTVRLHFPEHIKKLELKNLNAFVIQKALNEIKSSRMRLEAFDVYHGSLTLAYKLDIIQKDIASLLIKPKHVRKIGNALTSEELLQFFENIKGHRYETYFKFCLHTGARRQEALDFTYSDIFPANDIMLIKGTKTELSVRYIPVFPDLYEVLGFSGKNEFKEFVKANGNVRPFRFSASRISKEFKKLCPNHKLHDLRHTFATKCLENEISMKVVQSWLGHARLDTTASIYSHILPQFEKSEAKKFKLT